MYYTSGYDHAGGGLDENEKNGLPYKVSVFKMSL